VDSRYGQKEKKMAITKRTEEDKIEVVGPYKSIQVRTATVIEEDGVELSRSFHRHLLQCVQSIKNGSNWTHTDTDVSGESSEVQAIASAVWTTDVKNAKKTANENSGI
tara:strand:- start:172 stop:495 length:324 start_codon:yes stop_codon:yes gene_type:complete